MTLRFDPETRELYNTEYARLFNQENKHWDRPEHAEIFLKMQESWFNQTLAARGHLFLNEVYDGLGFPRVPAGQLVGWVRSEGQTVKFRLTPNDDGSVMIEINVDSGPMHHKI